MRITADPIGRREALRRVSVVLGGAISAPTMAAVLAGCGRRTSDEKGVSRPALSQEQSELIATIAEHIIPETDTPGARSVRVHEFIDEMLTAYYAEAERNVFLTGLAEVDERARQAHGSSFMACTPAQQLELVVRLDRETFGPGTGDADPEDVREQVEEGETPLPPALESDTIRWVRGEGREPGAEAPFFRTMKELTLVGYYTSEVGATQELRHEAAPGRYDGCVPLADVGKTWAV